MHYFWVIVAITLSAAGAFFVVPFTKNTIGGEAKTSNVVEADRLAMEKEEVALSYVLWYSVGRFFIEGMRTDSLWISEWIRVSQALSLALFIGAIVVWFIRRQDYPPISYYSDGNKGQKKTIKMVN